MIFKLPWIQFFAGAKTPKSYPKETLPEIAFLGRSNVGKSRLINALTNSKVVRVEDRPGVTKQLNFYTANKDFHLVDMPGYGFAFSDDKEAWMNNVTL